MKIKKPLNKLISETFGCAVLDTGCSKSCCSEVWLKEYVETLSENEKMKLKYSEEKKEN